MVVQAGVVAGGVAVGHDLRVVLVEVDVVLQGPVGPALIPRGLQCVGLVPASAPGSIRRGGGREGGRGSEGVREGVGGFGRTPPSSFGPPMVPAEGGPKNFEA